MKLMDAILASQNQQPSPLVPADDYGLDPAIEAQIQQLSQPEPVVDQPVPRQSGALAKILSSLADAGSAYAGRHSGYTQRLLNEDQEALDTIAGNKSRRAKSETDATTKGAELRLRALISKRDREAESDAKMQDRAYQDVKDAEKAQVAANQFQAIRDDKLAAETADEEYRNSQATWQKHVDQALIDNRIASQRPDRNAKGLASSRNAAVTFLKGAPATKDEPELPSAEARMVAGETAQQIMDDYLDDPDVLALDGADREEAIKYMASRLQPAIAAAEAKKKEAAATQAAATQAAPQAQDATGYMIQQGMAPVKRFINQGFPGTFDVPK